MFAIAATCVIIMILVGSIFTLEKTGKKNEYPSKIAESDGDNGGIFLLRTPEHNEIVPRKGMPAAAYTRSGSVVSVNKNILQVSVGETTVTYTSDKGEAQVYETIPFSNSLKALSFQGLKVGERVTMEVVVDNVYTRVVKN